MSELVKKGIPVITPAGGLGVHVDAMRFVDHIPQTEVRRTLGAGVLGALHAGCPCRPVARVHGGMHAGAPWPPHAGGGPGVSRVGALEQLF